MMPWHAISHQGRIIYTECIIIVLLQNRNLTLAAVSATHKQKEPHTHQKCMRNTTLTGPIDIFNFKKRCSSIICFLQCSEASTCCMRSMTHVHCTATSLSKPNGRLWCECDFDTCKKWKTHLGECIVRRWSDHHFKWHSNSIHTLTTGAKVSPNKTKAEQTIQLTFTIKLPRNFTRGANNSKHPRCSIDLCGPIRMIIAFTGFFRFVVVVVVVYGIWSRILSYFDALFDLDFSTDVY